MYFALEIEYKNFQFTIIIDIYILFFREGVYKFLIHNVKLIFM